MTYPKKFVRWDNSWISHLLDDGEVYIQLPDGEWVKRGPLGLLTPFGRIREIPDLVARLEKYCEDRVIADPATLYTLIIHTRGDEPVSDEELESVVQWSLNTPHWRREVMKIVMSES